MTSVNTDDLCNTHTHTQNMIFFNGMNYELKAKIPQLKSVMLYISYLRLVE